MTDLDVLRAELRRALDGLSSAERALIAMRNLHRDAAKRVEEAERAVRLAELFPEGPPLAQGDRFEGDDTFPPGHVSRVYLVPLPNRRSQRTDFRAVVQPDDERHPPYVVGGKP